LKSMVGLFHTVTILFFRAPEMRVAFPESAAFTLIHDADLFPWAAAPNPEYADTYRARFAVGHSAVIGKAGATVAFVAWVARGALDIDEIRSRWMLPEHDRCIYDVVTRGEFRGRGVYPSALSWFAELLAREHPSGCTWIYCDATNAPSRRGIEKAGYEFKGRVRAAWFGRALLLRRGSIPGGKP
jgi:RimJ/RimL family protein N-acetyltransferase